MSEHVLCKICAKNLRKICAKNNSTSIVGWRGTANNQNKSYPQILMNFLRLAWCCQPAETYIAMLKIQPDTFALTKQ
jgi:hypothetical protein